MTFRIAISGSASTGKSTLASALAEALGLPLIPEAMRLHLEAGHPRLDQVPREEACGVLARFRRELAAAEALHGSFVADNGALDLEAYAQWYGCPGDPSPWEHRYDAVILLPAGLLPYERDGVRRDDAGEEQRFQSMVEALAQQSRLGGRLWIMPADRDTVEGRVAWVKARLRA